MRPGILLGWLCAAPGLIMTAALVILAMGMWTAPGCTAPGWTDESGQSVACPWPPLKAVLWPIAVLAALTIYSFVLTIVPILYSWVWVAWRAVRRLTASRPAV